MISFPVSPLFVPANKLDWIEKAVTSEADGLILDLEDSVPIKEKNKTREGLTNYLSSQKITTPFIIRTNPLTSKEGKEDLSLLEVAGENFIGLMVPKIEDPAELMGLPEILKVVILVVIPKYVSS